MIYGGQLTQADIRARNAHAAKDWRTFSTCMQVAEAARLGAADLQELAAGRYLISRVSAKPSTQRESAELYARARVMLGIE